MEIVPVEFVPPTRLVGLNVKPVNVGGLMVRVARAEETSRLAVMVAEVWDATTWVVTAKVAVEAPPEIVRLAGTVADAWLLERAKLNPPMGAGPLRVTVPVDFVPPTSVVGFNVTLLTTSGLIASLAVTALVPWVAFMVALIG